MSMTSPLARCGKLLWTAYEYVAMVLGLGALALICLVWLPFALLCSVLPRRLGSFVGRLAIMIGFRLYLHFLTVFCACRFDLKALDALRQGPSLVVVANHPSLLDVVLIASRLPNAVCIMKAALMDNILLGAAARLARYIHNDKPVRMVRRATRELHAGAHLVIFPEGSRTSNFPFDGCTSAASLIARHAQTPVQTLFIDFSSPYLGKAWPLFRKPELPLRFGIRLGRRFDPPTRVLAFTAELGDYYRSSLSQPPAASAGTARTPEESTAS
ncbi:MAG: lysophospholipid acyltransferase family protein [Zoogloea sp.]|uniref:lysophospholipid acyltransferase family protein n=1 Tax=Zoogloea sp. TaxID=49181 RepID=UPI002624FA01|nr:lysophospholipid acyltransferase family protein [Zoogloea sp.]MDD2987799.1 lysophospholipid acyltransferase family protein [Zoogloea sp.]